MTIAANVYQTAARMGGVEFSDAPMTVEDYDRALRELAGLGFQGAEILTDPLLAAFDSRQQGRVVAGMARLKEETGLRYSVHLPFWWDSIAVPDEALRAASTANILKVIDLLEPLEPAHYVLHSLKNMPDRVRASRAGEAVTAAAMARVLSGAERSLGRIVERLADPRLLCLENLIDANFELELPLIEKLDTSVCLDMGHLFITGGDVRAFYTTHRERIRAIHAHNVRPDIARTPNAWRLVDHYGLATGLMDYRAILGWLQASGFAGTFVAEVLDSQGARDSIELLKASGCL